MYNACRKTSAELEIKLRQLKPWEPPEVVTGVPKTSSGVDHRREGTRSFNGPFNFEGRNLVSWPTMSLTELRIKCDEYNERDGFEKTDPGRWRIYRGKIVKGYKVRHCCVLTCDSDEIDPASLHSIPVIKSKNGEKKQKLDPIWIRNLRLDERKLTTQSNHVCSRHFPPAFTKSWVDASGRLRKKRLRKGIAPLPIFKVNRSESGSHERGTDLFCSSSPEKTVIPENKSRAAKDLEETERESQVSDVSKSPSDSNLLIPTHPNYPIRSAAETSQILELFKRCQECGEVIVETIVEGSDSWLARSWLTVKWRCGSNHSGTWGNQKWLTRKPVIPEVEQKVFPVSAEGTSNLSSNEHCDSSLVEVSTANVVSETHRRSALGRTDCTKTPGSKLYEIEKRKLIQAQFESGKKAAEICRDSMKTLNVKPAYVYNVISRLKKKQSSLRQFKSERKVEEALNKIDAILARRPNLSFREIARELKIPYTRNNAKWLAKTKLNFATTWEKEPEQILTELWFEKKRKECRLNKTGLTDSNPESARNSIDEGPKKQTRLTQIKSTASQPSGAVSATELLNCDIDEEGNLTKYSSIVKQEDEEMEDLEEKEAGVLAAKCEKIATW